MVSHHKKTAKKHRTKSADKRKKSRSRKMRGGNCIGASGAGVQAWGTGQDQLIGLNNAMFAPSNNSSNVLVAHSPTAMLGGKTHHRKKYGGSGLTAMAVPVVLVTANQLFQQRKSKKHKGKSFRRRSMRGGSYADASSELDNSMANGSTASNLGYGEVSGTNDMVTEIAA
jgi:hypothetical protein